MSEEIETYLVHKLSEAIKETESTEHCLSAKLFNLHSDFRDLKNMIENKANLSKAADESKRREKLYQLNNIFSDWQLISKKNGPYHPDTLKFAYNLNRTLKKIKAELQKKNESSHPNGDSIGLGNEESRSSLPKQQEIYRWSTRSVDPSKVRGLDDEALILERLLVKPDRENVFKAIGIVGMGGIGKTTFCQFLFSREMVKEYFLPRIWVCLSKQETEDPDDHMKVIVKRMLNCLGVEDGIVKFAEEEHRLPGLLCALRMQLIGKRYLIVFDDAWNADEFYHKLNYPVTRDENWGEKLAYGLPKGCGGAVVVTSRSEEIAKNMVGEENLRRLPLSDRKSCWEIFENEVKEGGKEFPKDLESLKDDIVDSCAGLPLSAKMMGQIMHQNL